LLCELGESLLGGHWYQGWELGLGLVGQNLCLCHVVCMLAVVLELTVEVLFQHIQVDAGIVLAHGISRTTGCGGRESGLPLEPLNCCHNSQCLGGCG